MKNTPHEKQTLLMNVVGFLLLLGLSACAAMYPPQQSPPPNNTAVAEHVDPPMPKWLQEIYEQEKVKQTTSNTCPPVNVTVDVPKDICKAFEPKPKIITKACDLPSLARLEKMAEWDPSPNDSAKVTLEKALSWKIQASKIVEDVRKESVTCL